MSSPELVSNVAETRLWPELIKRLKQLWADWASLSLYVVSACGLVWAFLKHAGHREASLLTWKFQNPTS